HRRVLATGTAVARRGRAGHPLHHVQPLEGHPRGMGQPSNRRADLVERWSQLHHGLVPSPLVRAWLRPMWTLARPLAALRVPPTAVTVAGVGLAGAAVLVAERWPLAALACVLAAAVADGLDGAIAVVAGRASRFGAVADTVADRIADTAFA